MIRELRYLEPQQLDLGPYSEGSGDVVVGDSVDRGEARWQGRPLQVAVDVAQAVAH